MDGISLDDLMMDEDGFMENPFDGYWALSDDIGSEVLDKVEAFDAEVEASGLRDEWNKKYRYYYGRFLNEFQSDTTGIGRLGENGEYIFLAVNHLRSIAKNIQSLAVQTSPVFDVRATTNDSTSIQIASLGENILEYYMRHKKVKENLQRAVEHCLIFDAGYVMVEWDSMSGKEHAQYADVTTGQIVGDGDVRVCNPLAPDVIFDPLRESFESLDWVIVREWVPRQELIARYLGDRELVTAIKAASATDLRAYGRSVHRGRAATFGNRLNDDVIVYKLFHRATDAVPEGRYAVVLAGGTVLEDLPFLPYSKIPIERVVADERMGSPFGYSPLNNILSIQEGVNALNSTILTNQYTHGVSIIAVQKGSDVNLTEFGRGMNVMYYDGQNKPEAVTLVKTPQEIFLNRDKLERDMEMLVGISDVARGMTKSGASGQGNALMASISAQNQGGLAEAYGDLCANVATTMLRVLRDHAKNRRTLAIAGDKSAGKDFFSGADLEGVERVYVDLGNPMTRTHAGRMQMAQDLLRQGVIGPDEFFEVLSTGNLKASYERQFKESNWIKRENELLMMGQIVNVHPLDNHDLHIAHHKSLLQREEIRVPKSPQDIEIARLVMEHINMHDEATARAQAMNMPPTPEIPPQSPGGGGVPLPQDGGPGGAPPGNPAEQTAQNVGIDMPSPAEPPPGF